MAYRYSMFYLDIDGKGRSILGKLLKPGKWNEVRFEWDNLQTGICDLYINGKKHPKSLPLNFKSVNGINYVHFQSLAKNEDKRGFFIESVNAEASNFHK